MARSFEWLESSRFNYQSKHGQLSKIVTTQGGAGGGLTPCATCRPGWRRTSARHLSRLMFMGAGTYHRYEQIPDYDPIAPS